MRRLLAATVAKWLGKRENREKVKRTVREFKSRIKKDEGLDRTRNDGARPGRTPGQGHDRPNDDHPRPGGDRRRR